MRSRVLWWVVGLALAMALPQQLCGAPENGGKERFARNFAALEAVVGPLEKALNEAQATADELAGDPPEERRRELEARLLTERERVVQLRGNLLDIIAGPDVGGFSEREASSERPGLEEQLSDVLEPLVGALREPARKLREVEDLRDKQALWQGRKDAAERVLARILRLEAQAESERMREELESARKLWEGRLAEASGQMEVLALQVAGREENTPSLLQAMTTMFRDFWKTRGLNLLLAIVVAVGLYVGVRRSWQFAQRVLQLRRGGGRSLAGRASEILATALAVTMAVVGVLMLFYLRGDWLLLTLAAVLLVSAAWAGKNSLTPYLQQVRTLLNIGQVREGERLIYRGLPWRVKRLGFHSILVNESLDGGELRIPLGEIMMMISRPADEHEPWFPTRKDDWVQLADGSAGKVVCQSPEQVVLVRLGGSLKTFPTADFLELATENLSRGFRIQQDFGIDYAHQAIATEEIPKTLTDLLCERLTAVLGEDAVRSVVVEFKRAAPSALEFEVLADFDGGVAARHRFLGRLIQRVCVEACTRHGWGIPFQQITIHQAQTS